MKPFATRATGKWLFLLLAVLSLFAAQVFGAMLYKSYVIRSADGMDILCDPYVVQKNDWLLKLFKQRGEISQKDFPQFLRIFKQINPQIEDIDRLLPGQHILIPLKELTRDALPGQSTGIVTLPFVTISDIPDILKTFSKDYTVQPGDFISRLISKQFATYGSRSYKEGIELFKLLNTDVADMNRIYRGQKLRLPDPGILQQPWYSSLFNDSGKLNLDLVLKDVNRSEIAPPGTLAPKKTRAKPDSPIAKAATVLNARLLKKGKYYFPRKGGQDLEIDLIQNPVLHLQEGLRIMISKGPSPGPDDLDLIRSFWREIEIVSVPEHASDEQIFDRIFSAIGTDPEKNRLSFSEKGVDVEIRARWIIKKPGRSGKTGRHICIMILNGKDEATPASISEYLKGYGILIKDIVLNRPAREKTANKPIRKKIGLQAVSVSALNRSALIKHLTALLGYHFAENISITFPYAGIQVKTVSNLISLKNGKLLLIDFGNFYGDAVKAIRRTGLDILQIKPGDSFQTVTAKLLRALEEKYATDPTFFAAKRSVFNNIAVTIPGFLVSGKGASKLLLSAVPLKDTIVHLLNDQQVKIIMVES